MPTIIFPPVIRISYFHNESEKFTKVSCDERSATTYTHARKLTAHIPEKLLTNLTP